MLEPIQKHIKRLSQTSLELKIIKAEHLLRSSLTQKEQALLAYVENYIGARRTPIFIALIYPSRKLSLTIRQTEYYMNKLIKKGWIKRTKILYYKNKDKKIRKQSLYALTHPLE